MTHNTHYNSAYREGDGRTVWDHAQREYLSGVKATTICQRYGMSLSSFRLHARAGGWRRMDQPTCDAPPEPGEYHPDDNVSFAELADEAYLNIRRALGMGRASEASTWLRVYERLADKARAHVMAELPDIVTPQIESSRDPLTLFAAEDENTNDLNAMGEDSEAEPHGLDSLHPVFQSPIQPHDRDRQSDDTDRSGA